MTAVGTDGCPVTDGVATDADSHTDTVGEVAGESSAARPAVPPEPAKSPEAPKQLSVVERVVKPAMEHLDATVRSNPYIKIRNTLTLPQMVFLALPCPEILYGGAAAGGKLLCLNTKIPTPRGWKILADIHAGDFIFGRGGEPCLVEAESQVVFDAPAWRLCFDDGSEIIANDEHLWLTFNVRELTALTRRDDAWREKRRQLRPSRSAIGAGTRWGHTLEHRRFLSEQITQRNKENRREGLPPPRGSIRTTAEIVSTLLHKGVRANHAIPVAAPLKLPDAGLPLDPYLLGLWLGDGTTSCGSITTMDQEILDAFSLRGWALARPTTKKNTAAVTVKVCGLIQRLRSMNLIGNKHVPEEYFWASEDQRLGLLQGLLDSDGGVEDGSVGFCSTKKCLADGVAHLVRSLGMKAAVREGRAKLYGRDCGPKWVIKFRANRQVFRLSRKAKKLVLAKSRVTRFRYVVFAERVRPRPMKCLRVASPDHLFLCGEAMIPTHNSAGLLAAALQYVRVPGYAALILRRKFTDLELPGSLIPRSHEWLRGTDAKWNGSKHEWIFPSGATLGFGYLEVEADKYRYQSSEFQCIAFDELSQFTETQYTYLFSRLRRLESSNIPLRMLSGSNPGGVGHEWVRKRFVLGSGKLIRAFIPARLEDNPFVDREAYELSLSQLDPVTRAQLRHGDWRIRPEGNMFKRIWFEDKFVDAKNVPELRQIVRCWDLAATEGPKADFTAGAKIGVTTKGDYFILNVTRFKSTPRDVEDTIAATAREDGHAVTIRLEEEPGSAGKGQVEHYQRNVLLGFAVYGRRSTGEKITRAKAFSAACEQGRVYIVKGHWNDEFLDELCAFPAEGHDDQVDAAAGAFNELSEVVGFDSGFEFLVSEPKARSEFSSFAPAFA